MKAAGHELKGAMCYYNCCVPGLNVPLMSLIDYRGYRVVALSILPIDQTTLVYGSSDAGITVHRKDPQMNHMMMQAGKILNLAPHTCGSDHYVIYGPADIEGHLGKDGNYYVIDYARTMPTQIKMTKNQRYVICVLL
eukprot:TRINITY_DN27796_c0_g1_i1.p1 TRINITY_DN27796_c0_g1~~TRINITY_DN27796_c0_g1_i1.p1  ORF type:complete len:158 (+),score=23.81 TRINITY_DN27796_c0_g1_i1:65-475(+)